MTGYSKSPKLIKGGIVPVDPVSDLVVDVESMWSNSIDRALKK